MMDICFQESDGKSHFNIALELCAGSMQDLFVGKETKRGKETDLNKICANKFKDLLQQATRGLNHLHSNMKIGW